MKVKEFTERIYPILKIQIKNILNRNGPIYPNVENYKDMSEEEYENRSILLSDLKNKLNNDNTEYVSKAINIIETDIKKYENDKRIPCENFIRDIEKFEIKMNILEDIEFELRLIKRGAINEKLVKA